MASELPLLSTANRALRKYFGSCWPAAGGVDSFRSRTKHLRRPCPPGISFAQLSRLRKRSLRRSRRPARSPKILECGDLSPLCSWAACRPGLRVAFDERGRDKSRPTKAVTGHRTSKCDFTKASVIRASPERVFAFHEQPDVLSLLVPPWESTRVIQAAKISELGTQAIIETKIFGPINAQIVAQHTVL